MKILLAAALACLASPLMAVELMLIGEYEWRKEGELFGGFSGIEVSEDGNTFTVISDQARTVTGTFIRKDGVITGVTASPILPLLDPDGAPLIEYRADSEGLAMDAAGQFYISFESVDRVWQYFTPTTNAIRLPSNPEFAKLQNNSALEALAIDENGTLYTLPERSGEWTRPFPVFRFKNGKWNNDWTLPRRDKYLPTGADFGPDGKFYLLERDFTWYRGFSSRIRRFDIGPDGFANEEILLSSRFGTFDNLEGLSAWRNEAGEIRLTLISDDNFSRFQKTEFVEFRVVEN